MRAHCTDLYDSDDQPIGDVWLSAPSGRDLTMTISAGDEDATARLSATNARDLHEALGVWLRENNEDYWRP